MSDAKSLEDYALAGADIQQITQLSRQVSKVKTERDIFKSQVKELEEALRYQLQRLEAMQNISKKLYSRPLIGRDIFYGGSLDHINVKYDITYTSSLFDILKSYSVIIRKLDNISHLTISSSTLYSVDDAIKRLKEIFGSLNEWTNFMNLIPNFGKNKIINKSSISSNFVASLELAKNGFLEVKQDEAFGNIFIKSKN